MASSPPAIESYEVVIKHQIIRLHCGPFGSEFQGRKEWNLNFLQIPYVISVILKFINHLILVNERQQ